MPGRSAGLRHRLLFAIVIVQLGLTSLAWAVLAPIVGWLSSRDTAGRIGRAAVSWIYRSCWATAEPGP